MTRERPSERRLVPLVILCLAAMAVVPVMVAFGHHSREHILALDFRAYYTAGLMIRAGAGPSLYDLDSQFDYQRRIIPEMKDPAGLLCFLEPPAAALPVAAIAGLPLRPAYLIWTAFNLLWLVLLTRLITSVLVSVPSQSRFRAVAMCLTFLPAWVALTHGQISFVLSTGLLAAWLALRAGRDFRAGLWLSLLLLKPHLAILPVLWLLRRGRGRALAGLVTGGTMIAAASLAVTGWDGLVAYPKVLLNAITWGDAYSVHPQATFTWRGLLQYLFETDRATPVLPYWLGGTAVALWLLLRSYDGLSRPESPRSAFEWSLLTATILFTSPHTNYHDLTLLLVPGVLVFAGVHPRALEGRNVRMLAALPYLGYIACCAPLLMLAGASWWRVPIVLFELLAVLVLAWVLSPSVRSRLPH